MSSRTDLLVRISELYYQQNLSQQDISKITRHFPSHHLPPSR